MKRLVMLAVALSVALLLHPAPSSSQEASSGLISGKVVETMDSGGYTYVCLEKDGKKTWLAVLQTRVVKGQTMSFKPGITMTNFESKTLKRTFDKIIFSDGPADGKGAAVDESKGSSGALVVPKEKIEVEKAEGPNAYTVAEVYKNRGKLNKKEIVVKGKVVKISAGIMQKNWLHLQDGSGDGKKGTHDLVVTSKELPAVGDIITVKGIVRKDRDFGDNYRYKVIMEDVTIVK